MMRDGRADAPNDELIWLRGIIEVQRGDLAAANAALSKLRRMLDANSISAMNYKPAYKFYLHLLALVKAREGKADEALQALKDLEWVKDKLGYWSTAQDRAFFMDCIGEIQEKLGSPSEAERAYRDALAYNPHYALGRFHLASLLEKAHRPAEAERELQSFFSEWSSADKDIQEVVLANRIAAVAKP